MALEVDRCMYKHVYLRFIRVSCKRHLHETKTI